jgi:hypothetical protein
MEDYLVYFIITGCTIIITTLVVRCLLIPKRRDLTFHLQGREKISPPVAPDKTAPNQEQQRKSQEVVSEFGDDDASTISPIIYSTASDEYAPELWFSIKSSAENTGRVPLCLFPKR